MQGSTNYDAFMPNWPEIGLRSVNFEASPSLIRKLKKEWQEFAETISPYPDRFQGMGIVICGGGVKYFTCAWVNIHFLRRNGCQLPIELWYSGDEMTQETIEALQPLNVSCRDVRAVAGNNMVGYVIKPFAILHSRFKEILFLDADNNCTVDPTYLFYCDQYRSYGAIFWPDLWYTDRSSPIWDIIGSNDHGTIEQESGQILVNKEKCWRELNLCLFFNLNSEYYYKFLWGDKDTFKFAWQALRKEYYMINTPVAFCGYRKIRDFFFSRGVSMLQHDVEGKPIFIHRNLYKWDITLDNEMIWGKIKRFKAQATRKQVWSEMDYREGGSHHFGMDIDGDVEVQDFESMFGDFESVGLDILKGLRRSPFYTRFLMHTYFSAFNPLYRELLFATEVHRPTPATK